MVGTPLSLFTNSGTRNENTAVAEQTFSFYCRKRFSDISYIPPSSVLKKESKSETLVEVNQAI